MGKAHCPNNEALTSSFPLNGPSPQLTHSLPQSSSGTQASEGHVSHPTPVPGEVCKVTLQNIKQEPREFQCDTGSSIEAHSDGIKREIAGEVVSMSSATSVANSVPRNQAGDLGSQIQRTETGQQLLQKLLRTKSLQLASQRPADGIHNEINGHINSKLAMLEQKLQGTPRNMEVWDSQSFLYP